MVKLPWINQTKQINEKKMVKRPWINQTKQNYVKKKIKQKMKYIW